MLFKNDKAGVGYHDLVEVGLLGTECLQDGEAEKGAVGGDPEGHPVRAGALRG